MPTSDLPAKTVCYYVTKDETGRASARVEPRTCDELPAGEVTVRIQYSSLNFKDALSASGNPGVSKRFPHVPGIDAAGVVVASQSSAFRVGDSVIITGNEFGAGRWGGYSQWTRVPADWPVLLPPGLSLRQSMVLGTAGFTAAQCVLSLRSRGVLPESGEVLVSGASGGVGSLAVALLAKLGYYVVAVSGKPAAAAMLQRLGAREILPREAALDASGKPLLPGRWAGAVDTVGGQTLTTIIRSMKVSGAVTACGLVGGAELPLSVHPFILRGVSLLGIDSAWRSYAERAQIWNLLANDWRLTEIEPLVTEIGLEDLGHWVAEILAGRVAGRVVVRLPD